MVFIPFVSYFYAPPKHRGHALRWLPWGRGSAVPTPFSVIRLSLGSTIQSQSRYQTGRGHRFMFERRWLLFLLFHNYYHLLHTYRVWYMRTANTISWNKCQVFTRTKFPAPSPHPRYPRPAESPPRAILKMPGLSRSTHRSPRGRTPTRRHT